MSKKILIFVFVIMSFLPSCLFPIEVERADKVSLELMSSLGNNTGKLISLRIASSYNFPFSDLKERKEWCDKQSSLAFTFYTPKKRPKMRIQGAETEWEFVENGKTKGRFKINKSDIYLIHQGKKITPNKIFWRDYEYDIIESSSVSYSNYSRYGTKYLTFPIPCASLISTNGALSDTKLIISKIYKDDKVIKRDIEFRFIKSKENRGYTIWLE